MKFRFLLKSEKRDKLKTVKLKITMMYKMPHFVVQEISD